MFHSTGSHVGVDSGKMTVVSPTCMCAWGLFRVCLCSFIMCASARGGGVCAFVTRRSVRFAVE